MTRGLALPNVGPGPDPFSLSELDAAFAVLLLHRDFYCSECRQQVRRVKSRYEEFEQRDAEVVSVLPEDRATAEEWQKQYHLPFPVVADEEKQLGDRFEQPTRYGLLGRVHDIIGRMPATIVLDLRWSDPMETYAHRGDSKTDRPRVDDLLSALDSAAALGEDTTVAEREAAARATTDGATPPASESDAADAAGATAAPSETGETPTESADATAGMEAENGETATERGDGSVPHEAQRAPETGGSAETDEPAEGGDAVEPGEAAETREAAEMKQEADSGAKIDSVESFDSDDSEVTPVTVPDRVELPDDIELRRATEDDAMPVIRVLHGALLEIDGSTVRRAVDRDDVIVAVADGWVVGALVSEDNHIDTLAVRREFRGRGIGSALVETAVADIGGPVTADFRAGVRGFWQDLDFEIEADDDRFYGIRSAD